MMKHEDLKEALKKYTPIISDGMEHCGKYNNRIIRWYDYHGRAACVRVKWEHEKDDPEKKHYPGCYCSTIEGAIASLTYKKGE